MPDSTYSGTFTALVTPFRDGAFDEGRFREQIARQIDAGVDGIVPVGTTGESPTLTMAEHKRVIRVACDAAAGKIAVLAGAGANATEEAAELHAHSKDCGATAALSVNPYYNKPTQEGLYRHFAHLSDRVDLPIVLYNIPGRCGVTMSAETTARLHRDHNVPATKEATGLPDMTSAVRAAAPGIIVLSGDDSLTLALMAVGASGVVSVASNVIPEKLVQLVRHAAGNDFAAALKVHDAIVPLCRALFLDGNPAGVKAAMEHLGTDTGALRLPLAPASDPTRAAIRAALDALR